MPSVSIRTDEPQPSTAGAARWPRPSRERPIDLVHLANQTVGDRVLEREILLLMQAQVELMGPRIAKAAPPERGPLAHALKGAARNVGAFGLGDAAAELEAAPDDAAVLANLDAELCAVRAFLMRLLA